MKKINIINDIIYEDNHIIVCNKREGILSQEDKTDSPDMVNLLKAYLKEKYQKPGNVYVGLVHRLDQRVSGVMVFSKTSKASSRLSEAIRNKEFNKEYFALATGSIDSPKKLVNKLVKDDIKSIESDEGKESILEYNPITKVNINNKTYTLLRIKLITGRFNQIRKQLSLDNHPIINDFKYGYKDVKSNDFVPLGLYCVRISFPHPITKEIMEFTINKELFKFNEYINMGEYL